MTPSKSFQTSNCQKSFFIVTSGIFSLLNSFSFSRIVWDLINFYKFVGKQKYAKICYARLSEIISYMLNKYFSEKENKRWIVRRLKLKTVRRKFSTWGGNNRHFDGFFHNINLQTSGVIIVCLERDFEPKRELWIGFQVKSNQMQHTGLCRLRRSVNSDDCHRRQPKYCWILAAFSKIKKTPLR